MILLSLMFGVELIDVSNRMVKGIWAMIIDGVKSTIYNME